MSDSEFKLQVTVDNSNITSRVPEEQKLRGTTPETNFNAPRDTKKDVYDFNDSSETISEHHTDHKEREVKDENHEKADLAVEAPKEDYVLTPVMTITKEEAVFTKGDLKLQKISVTEDISGTRITSTIEQENVSVINNGEPQTRTEVISVQQFKTDSQEEKQQTENRKPKTKIPTLRFRQAVDQLKQDRNSFEDKKEPQTPQIVTPRSAIPRLKDGKLIAPSIKDSTPLQVQTNDALPRLSDEFDKLYDEIVEDQDSLDNLSICSRIEDPVKVDNTFEEIIHAYEENKVQPINTEKVKQSKIPLLKRKSEQEIELPKQTTSVTRQSSTVDVSRIKTAETIIDSKIQSITLNRSPIRTSLISKRISEIKSVQESSEGYSEKCIAVNVATVDEINNNLETNIIKKEESNEFLNKKTEATSIKENLVVTSKNETDKVTMPIIRNMSISFEPKNEYDNNNAIMDEATSLEKIDGQNIITQKEEKVIKSVSSTMTSVEEIYNESILNVNGKVEKNVVMQDSENSLVIDVIPENKNEEDIPFIRGKVSRIINRMDSKENEIKQTKKDFEDETLKEKSVLSKIAIFQHSAPADITSKSKHISIAQTCDIKPMQPIKTRYDLPDRPNIVEEVLKLSARVFEENNDTSSDNNNILKTEIDGRSNNAPNKYSPKDDEIMSCIEIMIRQPLVAAQSDEPVESTIVNINEKINPEIKILNEKPFANSNTTKFHPIDSKNAFNVQIVDIQPKVPVESPRTHELPLESELNILKINDLILPNVNKLYFRPEQVEGKVSSPVAIVDVPSFIRTDSSYSAQVNSRTEIVERNTEWKTTWNTFDDKKNNTTNHGDLYVNEPVFTDTQPKIISDIIKQEVKFEHLKVNDEIKIKENGIFHRKSRKDEGQLRINSYRNNELDQKIKSKSLAELDLGDAVKGRVKNIIVRMKSLDRLDVGKKELIDIKERPRTKSVSEKIALFERRLTPIKLHSGEHPKNEPKEVAKNYGLTEEEYAKKIDELSLVKTKYGALEPGKMKYLELRDGGKMPALGIGTALLDPKLTRYVIQAAIDLGYRTIDTAYIYGNEKEVGEAINDKIKDGTVSRSELFIISKLWSTFHRQDLVQRACRASLDAMGLDYFDLYLIHNPMSFKEGGDPIPKIANVLQFSEHDYLEAWFGIEKLVREGLVRRGGVSNFNSQQVDRVVEKGKTKPVINQVECHPYLSQNRLDEFCQVRNVKLCCFGVLGSKGTPQEHKSALPPSIDDPLVRVMAAGLNMSPAALLISYQLALDRGVIVKASSAAHLWDNLQALAFTPSSTDVSALHALNRNKRTFTFKGLGDTHRNYPFNISY